VPTVAKLWEPRANGSVDQLLRENALGVGNAVVGVGVALGVGTGSGVVQAVSSNRDRPEPAPIRKLRRVNDISAPLYRHSVLRHRFARVGRG
jgi:hypothetical protein